MRMHLQIAGAAVISLATIWPQLADCGGAYSYGSASKAMSDQQTYNDPVQQARMNKKRDALMALRTEGLKLRDADGGKLTPEHEAYLQSKLDAINAGNF